MALNVCGQYVPNAIQFTYSFTKVCLGGCTLYIEIDLSETSSLVMFLGTSIKGRVLNKLQSLSFYLTVLRIKKLKFSRAQH